MLGSMQDWYLSRRIILIDTLSGREKSLSSLPKVIRVASSVKIRFNLFFCYNMNRCIKQENVLFYWEFCHVLFCCFQIPDGPTNSGWTGFRPSDVCELQRRPHHRRQHANCVCESGTPNESKWNIQLICFSCLKQNNLNVFLGLSLSAKFWHPSDIGVHFDYLLCTVKCQKSCMKGLLLKPIILSNSSITTWSVWMWTTVFIFV